MGAHKFSAFKVSDRELLASLARIAADDGGKATLQLYVADQQQPLSIPASGYEENSVVKDLIEADSALLTAVNLQAGTQYLTVARAEGKDEVVVTFPAQVPINADQVRFLASVHRNLRAYGRTAASDEIFGTEIAEFYRQREDLLSRLERLHTRLIESNEDYRSRLEQETDSLRVTVRAEHKARLTEMAAELSLKNEALQKREADLVAREAVLDNRTSTHVRRQLRQDLKKILAERTESFHLSRDTTRKRLLLHLLFGLLVAGLGVLFVVAFSGRLGSPAGSPSWFVFARLSFLTAALASAIIFYIRWVDQWFRQHADEEMRFKRLELDIDRASWVVEMALEWREEKGTELPVALLDRLSRNLFEVGPTSSVRHPGEDLASALLGASAGLSLRIPGVGEAKLDRKGIREFGKALPSEGVSERREG